MTTTSDGGPPSTAAVFADESGRGGTRPSRRHPAHPAVVESFNRSVIVFVTVCAKDKVPVFACEHMRDWLRRAWVQANRWVVGRYVVMPDHIHLFCAPATWPPSSVKRWTEYWKSMVARACKGHGPLTAAGGTASTPSVPSDESGRGETRPSMWPDVLWQRDCWDTQLRRGESYAEKWEYVWNNPVRAGLCSESENWPFQGEMNVLMWHD